MTSLAKKCAAAGIHSLTASGAVFGVFALYAISQHNLITALHLMLLTLIIDGIDGPLARKIKITEVMPEVDGKSIDHVVDFFNYAIVPVYFLLHLPALVHSSGRYALIAAVVLASCYWYGRVDQNDGPYYFKRFPCLWNCLVAYLFFFEASQIVIYVTMSIFVIATFIPSKYPTNSGLRAIENIVIRELFTLIFIISAVSFLALLAVYPEKPWPLAIGALMYGIVYLASSIYVSLPTMSHIIFPDLHNNNLEDELT